ncbi:MAG: fibrobacter succinogenes major paralogous domain-containing protein [Fibromonadaceae bacterium]|jgi:uncharacterized protein (TIGR02145 family)|nr:fibrobacter succinogenes major paralogous domain-containing protein [Fibromonadaceae bacterium]
MSDNFTDSRDGKTYKTVKIGAQIWMAENLNYDAPGSKCYENDPANGEKYGRLYDWKTAMEACPAGWHLPSNEEWDELYRFVDGDTGTKSPYKSKIAGKFLKSKEGWNDDEGKSGNGEDKFGFSALPGGFGYSGGGFGIVGDIGYWWSASEGNSGSAYYRGMYYYSEGARYSFDGKRGLRSVRCVQD